MDDVALRERLGALAIDVRVRFGLERVADLWEATFRDLRQ
jgi:hypothetical protein